jgi:hypothetical protein
MREARNPPVAKPDTRPHAAALHRSVAGRSLQDQPDETLVDLVLEQSISDRLRSLCRYVNALARFRPV